MAVMKVKDENGVWHDFPALVGPAGPAGADGTDYILTEADKAEIVNKVLAALPNASGVNF